MIDDRGYLNKGTGEHVLVQEEDFGRVCSNQKVEEANKSLVQFKIS